MVLCALWVELRRSRLHLLQLCTDSSLVLCAQWIELRRNRLHLLQLCSDSSLVLCALWVELRRSRLHLLQLCSDSSLVLCALWVELRRNRLHLLQLCTDSSLVLCALWVELRRSRLHLLQLCTDSSLVLVILSELRRRHFKTFSSLPEDEHNSERVLAVQQALAASRTRIKAAIARSRIEARVDSINALLPAVIRHSDDSINSKAHLTAWINRCKAK